jgi:hypothetical protein
MPRETLAHRLQQRDAVRFIGRGDELAFFDELLGDDPAVSVVLVHGEGGIGKSTLLREVARRATDRGRAVWRVDGRDLAPAPGELERALDGAADAARPLILFDTWERIEALGDHLRRELLPSLPAAAVVIIAGRAAPDAAWFEGGWERLVAELALGGLPREEAFALARDCGVNDPRTLASVVDWAAGSPLAITLAARTAALDPSWRPGALEARPDVVRGLVRHIARTELDGGNLDVATIAALARTTTRSMLREVLPEVDADQADAWLRGLSFAEPAGPGVRLHELARAALRADVRHRAPERERDLRARIADHLTRRALAGNPYLLVDVAELIDDPTVRWGFGADGSVDYRVDALREHDIATIEAFVRERAGDDGWPATRRLLEEAPERVVVGRDRRGVAQGFCIAVTPDNAPPACDEDPVLGPWLEHARATVPDGNALLWRDARDLTATEVVVDVASPVMAIINTASILRSGLVSPRVIYLPIEPGNTTGLAFAAAVGGRHLRDLDVQVGREGRLCHVADLGPDGMLAGVRAAVYAEIGLAAPPLEPAPGAHIDADTVKAALRNLQRPLELAASPLASGETPEERSASVRALLEHATEAAFGRSSDEELLRTVVRRGYLDASGSHESVAAALHLSRAAYFRRLRQASARVAAYVLAGRAD